MAKKSSKSNSTNHSLQGGLKSRAASANDSSRVIHSNLSVNSGATRKGTAVGKSEKSKDTGALR